MSAQFLNISKHDFTIKRYKVILLDDLSKALECKTSEFYVDDKQSFKEVINKRFNGEYDLSYNIVPNSLTTDALKRVTNLKKIEFNYEDINSFSQEYSIYIIYGYIYPNTKSVVLKELLKDNGDNNSKYLISYVTDIINNIKGRICKKLITYKGRKIVPSFYNYNVLKTYGDLGINPCFKFDDGSFMDLDDSDITALCKDIISRINAITKTEGMLSVMYIGKIKNGEIVSLDELDRKVIENQFLDMLKGNL